MIRVTARRSFISQWDPLSILVFHTAVVLTLIHPCRGQSEVIGSPQPVVAMIGDDVILPCHLEPVIDAFGMTLEWARPDLDPRFVLVWRDGVDLESKKHPLYDRRSSLFTHELQSGNISLKISKVKQSDGGRYRCFVPELERYTTVQLVVGAASSPVAQISRTSSRVVLQCESAGWYPEPELLWLDGEGNLLSAGPTETLRGPDDLYTVSSRVTVEKRHSNNITCRVQQKIINQSRETHIHVPDDFFMFISPSGPPSSPAGNSNIITGLVIGVVVLLILVLAVFFVLWKRRRIKCKNKTKDEKSMDSKHVEEGETQPLMQAREEETAVDITGERTNTSPVREKNNKKQQKMKQETHEEEEELRRKEEEEDLDSRGEQSHKDEGETQQVHFVSETEQKSDVCSPEEKRINPSVVIKEDKFTTEEETHEEEAVTGRGVKAEGGEGEAETKMEAGKEESGLQSTWTEKLKEQQLLVREAPSFKFTEARKKPEENQREEVEAKPQREENQRKLQSERRMEQDKDETKLKTLKNKDTQDHMEGKEGFDQDKNQLKFQPETKPETKKVETKLKKQKDKNKAAPKNQDRVEGKSRGNKIKGQNKNKKTENKLLPVSSEVPERTDLTVQEETAEENKEKEKEEEMRAQPEDLRRSESKKGAQEEVTENNEGILTDETCRKDEDKEKLQQGKEREPRTEEHLDMDEKPIKEQLEEPVSVSEGGVTCQEEPQEEEPMEFEGNPHIDQNRIKGRKYAQVRVLHTDQQQTGRRKKHQEKHEHQGRNCKRRKDFWEEENDPLMEVEGDANNQEDVPAGKRVKFQPDQELMCQEDQQELMDTH
ncbi:trichohyalin-like isoform X2 [Archocentrus centrarchus]|nr:trichohyalin-like isoform X2 [Archocentrus centrarchus]